MLAAASVCAPLLSVASAPLLDVDLGVLVPRLTERAAPRDAPRLPGGGELALATPPLDPPRRWLLAVEVGVEAPGATAGEAGAGGVADSAASPAPAPAALPPAPPVASPEASTGLVSRFAPEASSAALPSSAGLLLALASLLDDRCLPLSRLTALATERTRDAAVLRFPPLCPLPPCPRSFSCCCVYQNCCEVYLEGTGGVGWGGGIVPGRQASGEYHRCSGADCASCVAGGQVGV